MQINKDFPHRVPSNYERYNPTFYNLIANNCKVAFREQKRVALVLSPVFGSGRTTLKPIVKHAYKSIMPGVCTFLASAKNVLPGFGVRVDWGLSNIVYCHIGSAFSCVPSTWYFVPLKGVLL